MLEVACLSNTAELSISVRGIVALLPERIELGQQLVLKLFFPSGKALETVETLVQVVWTDIHLARIGEITGLAYASPISPQRIWIS